jgi:hypothetical protein
MVKRQTSPRPAFTSLSRSLPIGISRRLQSIFDVLAQRLTEQLSLATGGWPEGLGEEAPIRIRDASGHGAPKWRNFS